ncbi:MAG: glycoside hydrolase family 13 protein [Acidimicrobiia bacterium]|jgi:alpha-glucosidase
MSSKTPWWRHAVVYQVYVRSFADGNGDGTGDIEGIRSRLPYLRSLGVDAIWVNPWYDSPLHDGGYDVADYRAIHPDFGTLDEARLLIQEANEMGIRVLADLVPNHTSSEHEWFREAVDSSPGSPARRRYHFVPGRGEQGESPPNNWTSVFGGPAWKRIDEEAWYLHLFDETQPDLNWDNPEVRSEFRDIMRFWLGLGVSGFRVDVAHSLTKEPGYPDFAGEHHLLHAVPTGRHPFWDRHDVHEIVREWRSLLDEYDDKVMVAEAWLPNWERMSRYIRPGEYHQTFDFLFLESPWVCSAMTERVTEALEATGEHGTVPTWVLSNHDVMRHATRYALPPDVDHTTWLLDGDRSLLDHRRGVRRARAAALLMLALPGSVYIYQGEELGLPEVYDLSLEVIQDPVWKQSNHAVKGRDGCRVPLPWTPTGPSYGFGSQGSWLPQPDGWGDLSVASQDGRAGSTLELYRAALRVRTDRLRGDEELAWLDLGEDVLAFRRGSGVTCVVNFGDDPVVLPDGAVLLTSGELDGDLLPVDTAAWVSESPG